MAFTGGLSVVVVKHLQTPFHASHNNRLALCKSFKKSLEKNEAKQ